MSARLLTEATDITPDIEQAVEETVDWFDGEPMPTEAFIDRLCDTYADGWDIESYDNGAARKIMGLARKIRRERS